MVSRHRSEPKLHIVQYMYFGYYYVIHVMFMWCITLIDFLMQNCLYIIVIKLLVVFLNLFTWLCQVLVVACRIFVPSCRLSSCSMDLVSPWHVRS